MASWILKGSLKLKCNFSVGQISALYFVFFPLHIYASAIPGKGKQVIGQAGHGTGRMDGAPAWLQQQAPDGFYFPMHHRSKLLEAHKQAGGAAEQREGDHFERKLQDSGVVSWDLAGQSKAPPYAFYTSVVIGSNEQPFNVLLDTGSSLLWVKCECTDCVNASNSNVVPLNPPLQLTSSTGVEECSNTLCQGLADDFLTATCANSPNQYCYFAASYLDGSYALGNIVSETLTLVPASGEVLRPQMTVGCAYNLSTDFVSGVSVFDGILGLGRSSYALTPSLAAQDVVANSYSACLEGEGQGGHLLLGRTALPDGAFYTPLPSTGNYTRYWSAVLQTVTVNGSETVEADLEVILDTGSTTTLLPKALHTAIFTNTFRALQSADDFGVFPLPTCLVFRAGVVMAQLVDIYAPVVLNFMGLDGGVAAMEIPIFNLLNFVQTNDSSETIYCLDSFGVDASDNTSLAGTGDSVTPIIGAPWLRNFDILYDSVNERIGWIPLNCTSGSIRDVFGTVREPLISWPPATNPPAGGDLSPPSLGDSAGTPSGTPATRPSPPGSIPSPPVAGSTTPPPSAGAWRAFMIALGAIAVVAAPIFAA